MSNIREFIVPQPTEQTPVTVEDYPYGWRTRTQAQYWVETTKNGQRCVFRTLNPRSGKWNNPKKSTYSEIMLLYRDTTNGHIQTYSLGFAYNGQEALDKFLSLFPEQQLSEYQREQLKIFRAIIKTRQHISVSIVTNPTPEEQKRIEEHRKETSEELHKVFSYYLHEENKKPEGET
jgi:hypothetical protein